MGAKWLMCMRLTPSALRRSAIKGTGKQNFFSVNDADADIVVDEIKKAFHEVFGEIEDAAVRKVSGRVDRVGDLIL